MYERKRKVKEKMKKEKWKKERKREERKVEIQVINMCYIKNIKQEMKINEALTLQIKQKIKHLFISIFI